MAKSFNDVRDLVLLKDSVRKDGSIFKLWTMNIEFSLLKNQHNQDYWRKGEMYDVYGAQMHLSHDVARFFNQDKQFVGYVVLASEKTAEVDSLPKPVYFFKEEWTGKSLLYKQFRVSHNETHTFQFNDKEYAVDVKGDVKEIQTNKLTEVIQGDDSNEMLTFQFDEKAYALGLKDEVKETSANELTEVMQVDEPVSEEKEKKSMGCFPSFSRFFKRNKNAGPFSFSSSSSSELGLEEYSSSRSSPSLFGLR